MKFDIFEAFNQIQIKEKDEWKTAFHIKLKHYEYLIIFFDLINISTTF